MTDAHSMNDSQKGIIFCGEKLVTKGYIVYDSFSMKLVNSKIIGTKIESVVAKGKGVKDEIKYKER